MEVCQRGDVSLPRLDVVWVHGHLLRLVGILVGEACEAVAELMHDDGFEFLVVCHGEVVGVEDAPSAIEVGVHQYDDVLVGCPGEPVVECLQVERGEVAVAVESVEMRVEGRPLPHALAGDACPAVLGGSLHGDDLEAVAQGAEGLVGEEGLHRRAAVLDEGVHLALAVTLGQEGDVDASRAVGRELEGVVWGDACPSRMAYEDVARCHGVCHGCHGVATVVVEFHRDVGAVERHGCEKDILEGAACLLGLRVGKPFLEEGGEGVAVDDLAAAVVAHHQLAIALHWHL